MYPDIDKATQIEMEINYSIDTWRTEEEVENKKKGTRLTNLMFNQQGACANSHSLTGLKLSRTTYTGHVIGAVILIIKLLRYFDRVH